MKALPLFLLALVVLGLGCKTPSLAPGGAYSPTNSAGQVIYSDLALALTDASYKFVYETLLVPLRFERDNRANLHALNPELGRAIKANLDLARVRIVELDKYWATVRQAYKKNPSPERLKLLQATIVEMEQLIPNVQSQLLPMHTLTKPQ